MIELESMAVEMPVVEGHPNRVGFRGVLTVIDVASERAPSGAKGHRVVLTRGAAEAALPSLLGMAVDYAPGFDRHDMQRKVGVITSAEIVGRNLEVGGYLFGKDFPQVVEEIGRSGRVGMSQRAHPPAKSAGRVGHPRRDEGAALEACVPGEGARLRASLAAAVERLRGFTIGLRSRDGADDLAASAGGLGMSYEVTDVILADRRARVWTLLQVTFTGAAILRRSKAAYEETWIELV